jgi:dienelactone hydrolase
MKWPRLVLPLVLPAILVGAYIALQSAPPPTAPPPSGAPPKEAATASRYAPPAAVPLADDVRKLIVARGDKLSHALEELRRLGVPEAILVDIEVYRKAAAWAMRHNEFYDKEAGDRTLAVLDRGLLRASHQARGETPWLFQAGETVVRGYRSRIDGSIQPYAITLPADYGKVKGKTYRMDVVLHGRDRALTEVSFLYRHRGDRPAPADKPEAQAKGQGPDWVQIDIFGRGNNAYRWAGEADVFEVVDNFLAVERNLGRGQLLDPARVVLRGFSMGGAGTWHIGLHRPDRFCVLGPGAGFTATHGYIKGLPDKLPSYQEACLTIYDAVDYAENAADVPVVAYGGDQDPQLQAARNIEARLKPAGIPMTLLVAPGVGHAMPPEWRKKAEAEYAKYTAKGRPEYPSRVHFETYTLKYPGCDWVEILGLDHHYRRALVDARRVEDALTVQTTNVRALHLGLWPGATRQAVAVTIDGQKLEAQPYLPDPASVSLHLYLEKRDGRWAAALPQRLVTGRLRVPQKIQGLQGPIDDAFTAPFLCVRGRGPAWHEATGQYADASLERFRKEWSQYFRGELPVKDDGDVTPQDIASHHLILFGDPSSNSLIEQVLPGLPLKWTKEKISWDGQDYAAAEHVPVLIYPSPLATGNYVVLNSGHTFHAADLADTNALLYPRLGDHAILKLTGKDPLAVEVIKAGLFDDFWRLPK